MNYAKANKLKNCRLWLTPALRASVAKAIQALQSWRFFIKVLVKSSKILCLLVLLISCSENTKLSENEESRIEQHVLQSFSQLADTSKRLDSESYFKFFDKEKFLGLNADGTNWNSISDLRKLIEVGFDAVESVESLKFTNVKISVIDKNTAILVNEYEQILLLKNDSRVTNYGGGAQVWSKASGEWKLASISASTKAAQ